MTVRMLSLLSHSWRAWRRAPAVAILAASALALGVTATTAIYTFIQAVLLKPLPYANPDRYLGVLSKWRGVAQEGGWSYPDCLDFQKRNRTMAALGCISFQAENLAIGKQTLYAQGNGVSPLLMQALGVPLQAGSWFSNAPADLRSAVISDHLWREFGAPRDIVGKQITLNSVPYVVKGVAKPWFRFLPNYSGELWFPLDPSASARTVRDYHWLSCLAKMKPDVTEAQAKADMARIAAELEREYPDAEKNHIADVVSLLLAVTNRVRPIFLLLLGAAVVLLVIACGNVASLLLARSVARERETAVRVAIGASATQLAGQYIAEGMFVALLGAGAGLLGSIALVKLVLRFAGADIPRAEEVGIDANVLAVTLACAVVCGVLFSLAPLWQAVRTSPNAVLTNGVRSTASAGAQRVLGAFITAQIALSCALLVVAILCVQRLGFLQRLDVGFNEKDVTIFSTYIPTSRFGNEHARADYQTRLLHAMEAAHLARVVGFTSALPFTQISSDAIIIPEHRDISHIPFSEQFRLFDYQFRTVSPSLFTALQIPLISGRYLTDADSSPQTPGLVIDQTVASRLWPRTSLLGQRVIFDNNNPNQTPVRIVGVVRDVQDTPGKPPTGHVYVPYQTNWIGLLPAEWALQTRPGAQISLTAVENAIHSVDPQLAVYNFSTMEKRRQEFLGSNRLQSDMTLLFGLTALVLAVLGVYGVVSYTVRQRVPEMGTRLALGATSNGLLYFVLKQALVKAVVGGLIGVALVFASVPLLRNLDIGVDTPKPFVWSLLTVILSTALATIIPAWRASLLSPAIALRNAPESLWWRARVGYARVAHSLSSAVGADTTRTAEGTLLAEIAESTRQADSFSTAIRTALTIVTERIPAQAAVLLVRRGESEPFRCISAVPEETKETWSLPFDSLLVTRLAHYYPALPFTQADLDALGRWSQELDRYHAEEINTLRSIGPAVVVPVAVKSGISGILFVRLDSSKSPDGQTMRLLRSVASQLALMVENSSLTDRIVEQERLRRELALASEVQKRLFPEKALDVRSAQLVGYCLPARGVGGDYYDFLRVGPDQLGVALADVAGKGIAAALLMSVVQASLRSLADDPALSLSQMTGKINRLLCASTGPNSYATFFYARLDETTLSLKYVNGGHNPPFLLRNHRSGAIEELTTGGMIVGMFPFSQYEEGTVQLEPGDVLMLFTDGVSEAHNPQEEEFGEDRLKEALRRYGHLAVGEMSTAILGELRQWMLDAPQHDDLTFVLMKLQR